LQNHHIKSRTPKKKTRKAPLSKADRTANSQLASERVSNENIIAMIKRFKITPDRYRNRRKRLPLDLILSLDYITGKLENYEFRKRSIQ
jgi:hypothetical protein